jgi:hypothetical protein
MWRWVRECVIKGEGREEGGRVFVGESSDVWVSLDICNVEEEGGEGKEGPGVDVTENCEVLAKGS